MLRDNWTAPVPFIFLGVFVVAIFASLKSTVQTKPRVWLHSPVALILIHTRTQWINSNYQLLAAQCDNRQPRSTYPEVISCVNGEVWVWDLHPLGDQQWPAGFTSRHVPFLEQDQCPSENSLTVWINHRLMAWHEWEMLTVHVGKNCFGFLFTHSVTLMC